MRKYLFIILVLIGCHFQVLSQSTPAHKSDSTRLDSLIKLLPSSKDKDRVNLLNEIAAERILFFQNQNEKILYSFMPPQLMKKQTESDIKRASLWPCLIYLMKRYKMLQFSKGFKRKKYSYGNTDWRRPQK